MCKSKSVLLPNLLKQAALPQEPSAFASEFRRWRRKFEQYYLGSDMGVTNIASQQQAALARCLDADIEQYLYSVIRDNTPIFTKLRDKCPLSKVSRPEKEREVCVVIPITHASRVVTCFIVTACALMTSTAP